MRKRRDRDRTAVTRRLLRHRLENRLVDARLDGIRTDAQAGRVARTPAQRLTRPFEHAFPVLDRGGDPLQRNPLRLAFRHLAFEQCHRNPDLARACKRRVDPVLRRLDLRGRRMGA